jgi:uncharacterized protein
LDLQGSVVVITGASAGIGRTTAWAFARQGSTIVASARREERLRDLVSQIESQGGKALAVPCDVGDMGQVEQLAATVREVLGRCDVLVNNAGIGQHQPFAKLPVEEIERLVRTNYLGVLYCTKAFLPMMLAAGRGHVVNVASLAGRFATPGHAVYSSTKHAVVAFSESLHFEIAPKGLRATAINPWFVASEGFAHTDSLQARIAMKPEAVANLIVRVVKSGKAPEISIPRWLSALQAVRLLAPPVYRLALKQIGRAQAG